MTRKTLAILLVLATSACAANPGDRVARDVSIVRTERSADKLVARGMAFASVGDLTRAEQYLAAALDAGADANQVLPKLLRVCVNAGHHRAGISYAMPVLEAHPEDVHLRFLVAELRAATGDTSGAEEDLEKVVAEKPDDPTFHYAFARLLKNPVGDPVGADREFRAYLRVAPDGVHASEARASLLHAVAVATPAPPAAALEVTQ